MLLPKANYYVNTKPVIYNLAIVEDLTPVEV